MKVANLSPPSECTGFEAILSHRTYLYNFSFPGSDRRFTKLVIKCLFNKFSQLALMISGPAPPRVFQFKRVTPELLSHSPGF